MLDLFFRLLLYLVSNLSSFLDILRCFAALLSLRLVFLSACLCFISLYFMLLIRRLFTSCLLLVSTLLLEDNSFSANLDFKLLSFSFLLSFLLSCFLCFFFFELSLSFLISDFTLFSDLFTFLLSSLSFFLDSLVSELLVFASLCFQKLHTSLLSLFFLGLGLMPFISGDALVLVWHFEELQIFFNFFFIKVEIDAKLLNLVRLKDWLIPQNLTFINGMFFLHSYCFA